MELELIFVAIAALLQVTFGARLVDVSQSKMTLLEKQTMTAICRVGIPISYCRFYLSQIGAFNLSPNIPPEKGIEYYGAGLERGECGIRISNVRREHNGLITCHLGFPTESQESTGKIQLVVAQPPSTPKLNIRAGQFLKEGEKIQADCKIEGGRPVANISWFLGTEPITEGLSSPSYSTGPDDLQTVSQSLTLPVKYTDHGKDLRCVANHIALSRNDINHSIHRLNVNFPPKPKSSETEQFGFTIGQPGKVIVLFNANPKPNIHWEVGSERLTEGMKDSTRSFEANVLQNKGSGTWAAVLNIAKVTAKDVEKKYTLVARNEFGQETYKVAISTSPAPPADITAGAIAGIVVAVLVILLIIFILIFARAFGKWCFAGSKPKRQTGESKYSLPNIGSLTYKDYKPVKTEDGKKVYVSPEDEKKILLANRITELTVESEKKSTRRNSDSSGSMYETPIVSKSAPATPAYNSENDVTQKFKDTSSVSIRHSFPFFGKKRRLFPEDNMDEPFPKKSLDEEENEGLKLPPNIEQISNNGTEAAGNSKITIKFPKLFRSSKNIENDADNQKLKDVASDPLNEQIPVEINIEKPEMEKPEKRRSVFGFASKKSNDEYDSDENGNRRKSKSKSKVTLKTIFGIDTDTKNVMEEEEPFREMQQIEDRGQEDKILDMEGIEFADDDKVTEFKTGQQHDEQKGLLDDESSIKFPTTIPLRGRWGPKSRKSKTLSAPEMLRSDKEESPEEVETTEKREGILSSRWKKNKKTRPVSFADEPTIYNIRSDTESADHGSADKSSVSKLTEEKQQKRFLGQLLDSIKRKNKDKVVDNEALRNIPITNEKDVEQQLQKDHIQKDHMKTDGIVYAELDIARLPGSVVRRDDEKTEYAEIIHPKAADYKRRGEELRKSRENLSDSREHLTEDDGTITTPDGKKEAAV